jgi:REP element-mobilizing transposase RayT
MMQDQDNLMPVKRRYNRRSIRLKGYDYTQVGYYFITICTWHRKFLFGDVKDAHMVLNVFGRVVEYQWRRLPYHFKNMELDVFQIMPDHFHGIIHITGAKHSKRNDDFETEKHISNASPRQPDASPGRPKGTIPGSVGAIVQNFQSVASRKINRIRKTPGAPVWQRNYYERIVRDEYALSRIRKYIIENPIKWDLSSNS